jgi:hypothetical protein
MEILIQWIASEKLIIPDSKFIRSSKPAKGFVILMGNSQNFCDVDTVPGVRPVRASMLAEPCPNRKRPPGQDIEEHYNASDSWVMR